ncbi:hypothetical protein SRB5_24470 [Streptomyces sp. RB5]|uniref:Mycothiol-dependent maleylpyruvate isomerase metal-binding domain-containing protein n=1 Tax=Streptomyces smaragdinus TaxID=2585196 RepID=A0A7K0CHU3_9ACTN|nr:hypothetical protein [Streptomyces smaragdinus]MQY12314.1 hypothetical protein [Streptomyces smaragdinus]
MTFTADDVERIVGLSVAALREAEGRDWTVRAGSLDWECWETAEHLADALFSYAAQLGPAKPPLGTHVPFAWQRKKPGGPASVVFVERDAGTGGLLQVLETCGTLLTAVVRLTPPDRRAHHGFGAAGPEGFAAMGVVETLLHTYDIAGGLGIGWTPDAGLCARVLDRLFPDVEPGPEPWPTLLWATGRGELPGRERRTEWRWYSSPRGESDT